jgi:serine protease Do
MTPPRLQRSLIAAAVLAAFGAGVVATDHWASVPQAVAAGAPPALAAPSATAVPLPDFADLVARQAASVVHIGVVHDARQISDEGMRELPELPAPFRDLPGFGRGPQERAPSRGIGSGFIVSADGLILTNAHVVDGADEVTVRLTDRREFRARLLGSDRRTDVAVLKIDAKGLTPVTVGDPAKARVGEWVVAIGAPYGLDNSVTSGIISAKSRALPGDSVVPFIQTDAAVNPGNSGGPLFNLRGEVIGINSQIFSRSGGFQGLAFAIPIDVAMNVKTQVVEHGKVEHGRLGITIQEVNQSLAQSFGLDKAAGALVASVAKGSPAAKVGLEPGDVILRVDGREIVGSGELPALIAQTRPGTTVKLDVWRHGKPVTVAATVGADPQAATLAVADGGAAKGRLGVSVRPLAPEERTAAGVRSGVVVIDVAGAAERAGVQPGDVIVAVNNEPVATPEQLRERIANAGKSVALLVQRDDGRIFIPVTLG